MKNRDRELFSRANYTEGEKYGTAIRHCYKKEEMALLERDREEKRRER